MSALANSRKAIISHAVAAILGLIGGFLGHDLSGLQKPVEGVVNTAADAVEKVVTSPAPSPLLAKPEPPPPPADAGPPPPADAGPPAPADAGVPAK